MAQAVFDRFPGYFRGVPLGSIPPGGVTDEFGPSYDACQDFIVLPDGGLQTAGLRTAVCKLSTTTVNRINGIFFWRAPSGGEFTFLATRSQIFVLWFKASDGFLFRSITKSFEERQAGTNPFNYGFFEAFGDSVYYCDGLSPVLRIRLGDDGFPMAASAGPPSQSSLLGFLAEGKRAVAQSRLTGSSYEYAVVAVSRYGKSPPKYVAAVAQDPYGSDLTVTPYGPTGFCPTLIFDWDQADEDTMHLEVFRRAAGSGAYQFSCKIPRDLTIYTDVRTDGELGDVLPVDNSPPSLFRILRSYQDRMWAVGGYADPNRLSFSLPGLPDVWPPGNEVILDVASSGESITQLAEINGSFFVFCRSRIYRIEGNSAESYAPALVTSSIGCIAPRTLQYYKDSVVFAAADGIYRFNGSQLDLLSAPIAGVFATGTAGILPMSYSAGAVAGDRYFFSYNEYGQTIHSTYAVARPNRTLICDLRTGGWGVQRDFGFYCAAPYGNKRALAVGSLDYAGDAGDTNDRELFMLWDYALKDYKRPEFRVIWAGVDFGSPELLKQLTSIEVWYESIREVEFTIAAYREFRQIEKDTTTGAYPSLYTPTFVEEVTAAISSTTTTAGEENSRYWGQATWVTVSSPVSRQAKLQQCQVDFKNIQARSFSIYLTINTPVSDVTIRKVIFKYEPIADRAKGFVELTTS